MGFARVRCCEECKRQGKTFIYLTPEEIAIWKETAKPVQEMDRHYSNLGPPKKYMTNWLNSKISS